MSLNVSPELLREAEVGEVDDEVFLGCVRESLPYAWEVITRVVGELPTSTGEFADDATVPPGDSEAGQLLRAMASDPIRGAFERHFGVRLAFQNCHRVAAFRLDLADGDCYREFISPRAQLLNQRPEYRNC